MFVFAFVILSWVESRGHMQHLGKAGLGGQGCQPTAKFREIRGLTGGLGQVPAMC